MIDFSPSSFFERFSVGRSEGLEGSADAFSKQKGSKYKWLHNIFPGQLNANRAIGFFLSLVKFEVKPSFDFVFFF